jgi:PBP1b-binding outer membrane lipoprotein LpoB
MTDMKKLIYIIAASIFLFAGCENFLDTESYTKKNTSNFPATQADANK